MFCSTKKWRMDRHIQKTIGQQQKIQKGKFKLLINDEFEYSTVPIETEGEDQLRTAFKDGELLIDDSFEAIKSRTKTYNMFTLN